MLTPGEDPFLQEWRTVLKSSGEKFEELKSNLRIGSLDKPLRGSNGTPK